MIDSFINYLEYEKKSSPHTVLAYRKDLLQFQEFMASSFDLGEVTEASHFEIRAWIIDLVELEMSTTTVNRKIATLRSFYTFLLRSRILTKDPTYKIRSLKNPKKLPEFVQELAIEAVLEASVYEVSFEGQRDRMVMEFLYLTGVRLAELIGLKWEAIDLEGGTVKVFGKRKKERIIPITSGLSQNIISYKKNFEKKFIELNQNDYFIVGNQKKQSYPMMIYRIVRHYLDLFAQTSKRSPHVLRHTFATHLLNKGADLNAIKDLLGHANLAATQVYTHNSLDKLKAVFEQAHPKA